MLVFYNSLSRTGVNNNDSLPKVALLLYFPGFDNSKIADSIKDTMKKEKKELSYHYHTVHNEQKRTRSIELALATRSLNAVVVVGDDLAADLLQEAQAKKKFLPIVSIGGTGREYPLDYPITQIIQKCNCSKRIEQLITHNQNIDSILLVY